MFPHSHWVPLCPPVAPPGRHCRRHLWLTRQGPGRNPGPAVGQRGEGPASRGRAEASRAGNCEQPLRARSPLQCDVSSWASRIHGTGKCGTRAWAGCRRRGWADGVLLGGPRGTRAKRQAEPRQPAGAPARGPAANGRCSPPVDAPAAPLTETFSRKSFPRPRIRN